MSYIDRINVQGTEYDVLDRRVRLADGQDFDYGELKQGGINKENGYTTGSVLRRSETYWPVIEGPVNVVMQNGLTGYIRLYDANKTMIDPGEEMPGSNTTNHYIVIANSTTMTLTMKEYNPNTAYFRFYFSCGTEDNIGALVRENARIIPLQTVATSGDMQILSDDVSDLKSATKTDRTALIKNIQGPAETITISTGKFWDITDNVASLKSSTNFKYVEQAVNAENVYVVHTRIHPNQYSERRMPIIFADDNYNVIKALPFDAVGESSLVDFIAFVPTGATKMLINSYGANPSLYSTIHGQAVGLNNMFYAASGKKPTFSYPYNKNQNTVVTVTLPTSYMYFVKQDGTIITYPSTAADREFSVPSGQALVWSLDTNIVSVKARTAVTVNDLILFLQLYGSVLCGLFKPFYDEIFGDGIRSIQDFIGIPREYDTEDFLNGVISQVQEKQLDCGRDMFAFITDTHNNTGRQHQDSPKILQCIARNTGLNKVVTGGDWIYATGTEAEMYQQMWDQVHAYKSFVSPFAKVYNVRGNHDLHITNAGTRISLTEQQVFNVMYADMEDIAHFNDTDPLGMYFWFDSGNLRYLCLNSVQPKGTDETSQFQKQVAFFTNVLSETPADKKFVWITHIPMLANQSPNYTYAVGTFLPLVNSVAQRTVCVIAGHNHEDMMDIVDGVVYVTCNADCRVDRDASMRTTETGAFDVVCVDVNTSRCDLIRVGQGENRAFTFGANPSIIS